ncbi:O-methyltransferase family 2 [Pyrenophora tritici-repentis]|nr:hypothetical protein L13192_09324 [Pyrenophora tritici-repentis]KAI2484406.1 O-methyltransferase family 2 [Pyrenophora tritici-repentis]
MASIDAQNLPLTLAKDLFDLTAAAIQEAQQNGSSLFDFSVDATARATTDRYADLQAKINTAALDLVRLINGPKVMYRHLFVSHYDLAAYQVALEFDFFNLVPLDGTLSVSALAEKAGMDSDRAERILRTLATQRVFEEVPVQGGTAFKHTAASALIVKEPLLKDAFLMQADEMFRAAAEASQSIRESPFESSPEKCGFYTKYGKSTYEWYKTKPDKAKRFANAMAGLTQLDRQTKQLHEEFDWAKIKGTVVDVGGGSGHVSLSLAQKFDHLHFVVQDASPVMLSQGESLWTGSLKNRVQFKQHNYYEPQPVRDAGAFFIRQVVHNLNDSQFIKLLQAAVPALEECEPDTPLLINDTVLPNPGEKPAWEEWSLRQMDLCMWVCFGAKQRSVDEFRKLIREVDSRLELVKVHSTGPMGLLEVRLLSQGRSTNGVNGH